MTDERIETVTGMCVVALTRHIMKKEKLDYEAAYRKLFATELYKLLQDAATRLFLETNEYLCEVYDREIEMGWTLCMNTSTGIVIDDKKLIRKKGGISCINSIIS